MPIEITIRLYNMPETCEELAKRTGKRKPYTPQRVYQLVEAYLREHAFQQGRFFLTEEELINIATQIKQPGRPRKPYNP